MPFKDRERHNQYTREVYARRRAEWFAGKSCEQCSATENLQLDHRNPQEKIDHRIWSWSLQRREVELAKCRPLCKSCHDEKSNTEKLKGTLKLNAKLTDDMVREIRLSTDSYRTLAARYNVALGIISRVKSREDWKHVV